MTSQLPHLKINFDEGLSDGKDLGEDLLSPLPSYDNSFENYDDGGTYSFVVRIPRHASKRFLSKGTKRMLVVDPARGVLEIRDKKKKSRWGRTKHYDSEDEDDDASVSSAGTNFSAGSISRTIWNVTHSYDIRRDVKVVRLEGSVIQIETTDAERDNASAPKERSIKFRTSGAASEFISVMGTAGGEMLPNTRMRQSIGGAWYLGSKKSYESLENDEASREPAATELRVETVSPTNLGLSMDKPDAIAKYLPNSLSEPATKAEAKLSEKPAVNDDASPKKDRGFTPRKAGGFSLPFFSGKKKRAADKGVTFTNIGMKEAPPFTTRILVEVVGCTDLGRSTVDPYVTVKRLLPGGGEEEVHRTDRIDNENNPIYTVLTKSLFLVDFPEDENDIENLDPEGEGPAPTDATAPFLIFRVIDYNPIASDVEIGTISVSVAEIREAIIPVKGEQRRLPYALTKTSVPSPTKAAVGNIPTSPLRSFQAVSNTVRSKISSKKDLPVLDNHKTLHLRFREATVDDIAFVTSPITDVEEGVTKNDEAARGIDEDLDLGGNDSNFRRRHKIIDGVKKYRVMPRPDPRDLSTKWMSAAELQAAAALPSTRWVKCGDGTLGHVYLEVLQCTGLPKPNLDAGGLRPGYKTDAFVNVVFEDTVVRTAVIKDCLNPVWVPWCQRAFVMRVACPDSPIFLGIFHFDDGYVKNHDKIGRVTINLSNLVVGTEYTLTYNIHKDHSSVPRKVMGKIQVRLRIEWMKSAREVLLASLSPRANNYMNVMKAKTMRTAKYTCQGKPRNKDSSIKYITDWATDVGSHKVFWWYVLYGAKKIVLWRPHPVDIPYFVRCHPLSGREGRLKVKTFQFPLDSLMVYLISILLVEYPDKLPTAFLSCIALGMLGCLKLSQTQPSPWKRCSSIFHFLFILIFNTSSYGLRQIEPNEFSQKAEEEHNMFWDKYIHIQDTKRKIHFEIFNEEMDRFLTRDCGIESETKKNIKEEMKNYDILKPFVDPYRPLLEVIRYTLRVTANVVTWEDSYLSFWITGISLVLAVISWFIPWGWLMLWCSRVIVWVGMGPWMSIVDKYYVAPFELKEEDLEDLKNLREKLRKSSQDNILIERIKKEEKIKCRDMQIFHFGEYVVKIPGRNFERVRDYPLPESSAVPFTGQNPHKRNILVIPGRKIRCGSMIQTRCETTWKNETTTFRNTLSENDVLLDKSLSAGASQDRLDVPQGNGFILSKVGLDSDSESTPLLRVFE